jgi:hypothetical protein
MSTTPTPSATSLHGSGRGAVATHAEQAVQKVADASIWLLFRINGVKG